MSLELADVLRLLGILAATGLAALAVLGPTVRARATGMGLALVLGPVLLLSEVWSSPQVAALRDDPVVVAAAIGLAVGVAGALAVIVHGRPALFVLAAAAALPFRVPIEVAGQTANLLLPLYLVIGAGALAWLVPRLRSLEPGRPHGWLERLLCAAVVVYALQAAYSADLSKALEQVVFFYVPFLILFALLREVEWTEALARRAFTMLLVLALVFAAIGFWEYQARELLLNPKVIASNQIEEYFRVNSLFFDPNIYGRFLAVVMLGLAAVLLWGRSPRQVAPAAAGLAVLWGGLLLTLSQSSFAALLGGLAVLGALRFGLARTAAVAGTLAAAAAAVVLLFPGALGVSLGSRSELDSATSGRYDLVRGGVELAADRPVLGWGSAAFTREYRRQEKASSERAAVASHTIPVTVAAEQGALGLAIYAALIGAALVRLLRGARRSPAAAAVAAAFVALVLHTWLYAAFLEDPLTWALLAVGAALPRD